MSAIRKSHNSISPCVSLALSELDRNSSRAFQQRLQYGPRLGAVDTVTGHVHIGQCGAPRNHQGTASVAHKANAMWGECLTQERCACGLCSRRVTKHRLIKCYPSSPCFEATKISLSLCDSGTPLSHLPLGPGWVTMHESLCTAPLRGHGFLLAASHLTCVDKISAEFHSQILCGLHLPALVLQTRETGMRLRPLALPGDLCNWDIPVDSQPSHVGAGSSACFWCPPYRIDVASLVYPWLYDFSSACL